MVTTTKPFVAPNGTVDSVTNKIKVYDYLPQHRDDVPVKRNYKFKLTKELVGNWHDAGHFVSLFFNALSMFFPPGETMFVKAVLAHRDIYQSDPILNKQCQAFVSQESIHGREHQTLNEGIRHFYPAVRFSEWPAEKLCDFVLNYTPRRTQLAATVALEHWTGCLAGALLKRPESFKYSDRSFGLLWNWHAYEELEHKAVAFDVYTRAYGNGVLACLDKWFAFVLSTVLLWTLTWFGFIAMIISDGSVFNLHEWGALLYQQWGNPGQFRLATWPILSFFWYPFSFHPWLDDDKHLLHDMDKFEEEVEKHVYVIPGRKKVEVNEDDLMLPNASHAHAA